MPGNATEPPGSGTLRFALKVQDCNIEVSAQLPGGTVGPTALLPILQGLSNSMSDLAARGAAQVGEQVSCREGCAACCRHPVPLTPLEARMLSEWLDQQPEGRKAVLRERIRKAAARLEEAGIARRLRESTYTSGRSALHALGLEYFALGIPCPFLEEERCSIYSIRPMRCREYMVVSPAERCAHPDTKEIVSVKPPVLLSQILAQWDVNGDRQPHELILLTMLDEWVAQHPAKEDRAHRTAPEMLKEFLQAFARDAQHATDARGDGAANSPAG